MRRSLCAIIGVFALSSAAWADTSSIDGTSGMGILENDYVKAGVNKDTGTFGSGGNTSPGLLFDSTGSGTFNTSYDYLTPGSPFDGFSVKIDGTNYTNNNTGTTDITGTITGGLTDGTNTLTWTGDWTHDSSTWSITNQYTLGTTTPYIDITSTITAGSDASTLYFGRFIDPDARAADGDSSSTDNVLGYGSIPDSNVVFSEALSSRYALGLYSTDSNVDAGISGWSTEADGYTENTVDGDGSLTNTGDNTIGLTWAWTGVSTGDIVTVNYSYIFGPSAFDAATDAVDGGAGGGADILTGELTDVGSATDAAGGAATVTGSTTSTLTTHDVTDDGKVQTVARTVYTGTADVYSDGTTGDVTTTTSSLPQVTARVDQYTVMDNLSSGINRSMVTNPWRDDGDEQGKVQFFINGNYGKVNMDNYDAKIMGSGITVMAPLKDDWKVGLSFDRIQTTIDNDDSNNKMNKTRVGISSILEMDRVMLTTDLNFSYNQYEVERRIHTWENSSDSKGYDAWVHQRAYYQLTDNITPFIGGSIGEYTRDEVIEEGYILSARTIAKKRDIDKYAEGGVRINFDVSNFDLFGQVGYTTDKWLTADAGISYDVHERGTVGIIASRSQHDELDINKVMLRGNIKF